MKIVFFLSGFFFVYTMIGYPFFLKILSRLVEKEDLKFDNTYEPIVSIIIPAHNEEKVIGRKIENLLNINYKKSKYEIIITSDNSTDNTNSIVNDYSKKFENVRLIEVKLRKGKTNAQDEAVEQAKGEIIVFSDANSMLNKESIKELVKFMSDDSVGYVAGKLEYVNEHENLSTESEESYWNYDLEMRQIESDISSITAGNGALYSVRKKEYEKIDPIYSHDSFFPPLYVVKGKSAKFNSNAIAYEKSGETLKDEFKRKVRMSRKIIKINFVNIEKYNIVKYGYFSFFYFSHRFCRNFLFLFHILFFLSNIFLAQQAIFRIILIFQLLFYMLSLLGYYRQQKFLKIFTYYSMTILAQLVGAFKEITGQSKPFWEVIESTR